MVRILARIGFAIATAAIIVAVLAGFGYLIPIGAAGASSMGPTVPGCDGRVLAQAFTYKLHGPHHGDIAVFRVNGSAARGFQPDVDGDHDLVRRVVGVPGDVVSAHDGYLEVNGERYDDLVTKTFKQVELAGDEYFVIGDNRSASQDSRSFGPVPRDAFRGKVFLVYWPLHDVAVPGGPPAGRPPGNVC